MELEVIARCNSCQKAHKIVSRQSDKQLTVDFICRCGNTISGMYDGDNWSFNGAENSEREEGEPVFIHEPEMT